MTDSLCRKQKIADSFEPRDELAFHSCNYIQIKTTYKFVDFLSNPKLIRAYDMYEVKNKYSLNQI